MNQQQIEEFLSGNEIGYLFDTTTFQVISYDPEDETLGREPFASVEPGGDLLFSHVLEDPEDTWLADYVWDGTDRPSVSEVREDLSHGDWQPVTLENVMRAWLMAAKDRIKTLTGLTVEEPSERAGADRDDAIVVSMGRDAVLESIATGMYEDVPGSSRFESLSETDRDRFVDDVWARTKAGLNLNGYLPNRFSDIVNEEIESQVENGLYALGAVPDAEVGHRKGASVHTRDAAWVIPIIDPVALEVLGTAVVETHAMEDEESPWGYSWSTQAVASDLAGNTMELDGTMYWGHISAETAMLDSLDDLAAEYDLMSNNHALFEAGCRRSVPVEVFYQVRDEGIPCPTVSELTDAKEEGRHE